MSGSSGGGGGVYASDDSPCESIVVDTVLNSPNPAAAIKKGDKLRVQIQAGSVPLAVCVIDSGAVAGSLTFGVVRRLIKCMEEGHTYVAEVTAVDGGRHAVRIKHT